MKSKPTSLNPEEKINTLVAYLRKIEVAIKSLDAGSALQLVWDALDFAQRKP